MGNLIFRDYCKRIIRYENGTHEWIQIPRHYNEETISGVLDGIVNPDDEDSEVYPFEMTMLRWHHWFILNQLNIEGHMKSIGYRLL